MNGQVVGRALAETIRPALRALGFDTFQGRHAWRRNSLGIDVVSFPSMSSYTAHGVGCTSYSFGGEVAVYFVGVEDRPDVEWPRPWQATLRANLGKTLRQPYFHPWGVPAPIDEWRRDRPDVWYVLEDGSNVGEVAHDALRTMVDQGLPFIDLVGDPSRAAHYLATEPSRDTEFGRFGTVSLGSLGSPLRIRTSERLRALAETGRV